MKEIPLNEFITLQRGFDLPEAKRIPGHVPVVASTGIVGFHNEAKVKANGVVLGRSGSIGGGQYITNDFFPLNTTLYVKDFKGHNPRYIYYLLKNIDFKRFNSGSGVPTLNRNHLSSLLVREVSHKEEIKIAQILGTFDDKIHLNNQINQTLEAIAQAIFKSWFIDFDPVKAKAETIAQGGSQEEAELAAMRTISGKSTEALQHMQTTHPEQYQKLKKTAAAFPSTFVDSELGEIPEGWEYVNLGSLLESTIGGDWGKEVPDEKHTEQVAILRGTDLLDVYSGNDENVPIRFVDSKKLKPRKIQNGDIIIEVSGGSKNQPTGRSLFITKNIINRFNKPIVPASFCRLFRPKNLELGLILGIYLQLIYTQGKTWEYQVQSTGISNFQTKHFLENELIIVADKKMINNFFNLFHSLIDKISSSHNSKLAKTRDALLPKLLNGELS